MSNSLRSHGLYSPWNSLSQNTGVGGLFLLQGIFPTQGSNPGLPHCRQILYHLSHIMHMFINLMVSHRSLRYCSFFFIFFLSSPALSWTFFVCFFFIPSSTCSNLSLNLLLISLFQLLVSYDFSSLYWSSAFLHTLFSCFSLSSPRFPSASWAY